MCPQRALRPQPQQAEGSGLRQLLSQESSQVALQREETGLEWVGAVHRDYHSARVCVCVCVCVCVYMYISVHEMYTMYMVESLTDLSSAITPNGTRLPLSSD